MKVIFDVLGAPPKSGGPFMHAVEILRAWSEEFPEDRITLLGPAKFLSAITQKGERPSNVRLLRWPNNTLAFRIFGQMVIVPLVARSRPRAALLVSLPVLSPFSPASRSYCFAHDWRHLRREDEFSLGRRIYRSIWMSSVRRAAAVFCISGKTLRETAALAPEATLVLATNGVDHVQRWTRRSTNSDSESTRTILTFGHRASKRPALTIRAFALLNDRRAPDAHLVVLGTTRASTEQLRELAVNLGIGDLCSFPGFVDEAQLQDYFLDCTAIVLASTDEGFGLPVGEALFLGKSAIVTTDGGLHEIYGDQVLVAEPTAASVADRLHQVLSGKAAASGSVQKLPSWKDCVKIIRTELNGKTLQDRGPGTQDEGMSWRALGAAIDPYAEAARSSRGHSTRGPATQPQPVGQQW